MKTWTLLTSALILLCTSLYCATKEQTITHVVIFDLGDVLGHHSEKRISWKIFYTAGKQLGGIGTLMREYLRHPKSFARSTLFNLGQVTLNKIAELAHKKYPQEWARAADEYGNAYGEGLCLLQAGMITCEEIMTFLLQAIAEVEFESKEQAALVQASITICFGNMTNLVQSYRPIKPCLRIVQKLKKLSHVKLMILSNFPPEQFQELMKQPAMKPVFDLFNPEDIFYSGMRLPDNRTLPIKPDHRAFQEIIAICKTRFNLPSHNNIIFIDNQQENVLAAQNCGLQGLLVNCKYPQGDIQALSFAQLEKELQSPDKGLFNPNEESLVETPTDQLLAYIARIQQTLQPHPLRIAIPAGCIIGLLLWQFATKHELPTTTNELPTSSETKEFPYFFCP